MEAKELRLGNIIYISDNIPCSIEYMIGKCDVFGHDMIDGVNIEKFSPIPLTEEWLLKFGFDKKDWKHRDGSISEGVFNKERVVIEDTKEGILLCLKRISDYIRYDYIANIDHVHQLQNLFFALTGEELTIKN